MRNDGSSAGFSRAHLVDPRQHAGGGGFAVRARNDKRFAAFEKFFVNERGHGGEGNALVEDVLDFRIAARECIADDHEIRRGIEVGLRVRLEHGNAQFAQQIAHWRIGGLVGTCDAMSLQLKKPCERRHCGAANAAEVNVAAVRNVH